MRGNLGNDYSGSRTYQNGSSSRGLLSALRKVTRRLLKVGQGSGLEAQPLPKHDTIFPGRR